MSLLLLSPCLAVIVTLVILHHHQNRVAPPSRNRAGVDLPRFVAFVIWPVCHCRCFCPSRLTVVVVLIASTRFAAALVALPCRWTVCLSGALFALPCHQRRVGQ